jgi:hypothetical protein
MYLFFGLKLAGDFKSSKAQTDYLKLLDDITTTTPFI